MKESLVLWVALLCMTAEQHGTHCYNLLLEQVNAIEYAVEEVVFGTLEKGSGGVIALDRDGHFSAQMNTSGMYHGWVYEDGKMETRIFIDE